MDIDSDLLERFETGLDPQHLERSAISAQLIGFGEISAIFQIAADTSRAYKRMPLFETVTTAEQYADMYHTYCHQLTLAGLQLPDSGTHIVALPQRPVVLYIVQAQVPAACIANRLIQDLDSVEFKILLEKILGAMTRFWEYNRSLQPDMELALDGQISNWALTAGGPGEALFFIDTSTPFIRHNGVEQLDPELLLQAAPSFLRWLIRWLFVEDVMTRYYDPRQVLIDLAANLIKEQRPDLVAPAVDLINAHLPEDLPPVTLAQVDRYYREDKFIWSIFLTFRKLDRALTTYFSSKRYEFILPGSIKR
ncbi:MAG: hypothetical protein GY697_06280 [Desulfobacterales bacterium]|nr:hypothetical protein [Desulfobacterales bacterium]